MRRRSLLAAVALMGLGGLTLASTMTPPPTARASAPPATRGPLLALLATEPEGDQTRLIEARAGEPDSRELGRLQHLPGAVVRGAVWGRSVLVVADTTPTRELSWAASLWRLTEGEPAHKLVEGVYHGSRPLVTASGRVFVERGAKGPEPEGDEARQRLRVDDLAIDEVDPATGATRQVYSGHGYATHLVGEHEGELLLYRVGPDGADLAGLRPDGGELRLIVPRWPARARDFSVADGGLVLQQIEGRKPRVERVDLATGERRVLIEGDGMDLVPFALPGGAVLHGGPGGARCLGGAAPQLLAGGFLWARAQREGWVAGLWMGQGLPRAVALRASDGAALEVPQPPGLRVEVAGVLEVTP